MIKEESILSLAPAINSEESKAQNHSQLIEEIVVNLYLNMRPQLVSYVYNVIGSTNDSEDLVQDAFLKLFDHLARKAQILNVRGWLYKVVHNLAINQAVQTTNRGSLFDKWSSTCAASSGPPTAEEDLIRRQFIEEALAKLNDTERNCLMLRAEGLSYSEISSVLGISAKAVSVHLVRGAKKFAGTNGNHK